MSTVLELVKAACYRWNLPFPAAGTLFGNTDPGARQLLYVLYAVAEELRQAACWTQQKKLHSFSTSSGRSKYPLPEDFYAPSPFTEWNTTESRMLNSVDDIEFGSKLYGGIGSSTKFDYRFFGPDSNPNTGGGQFQVYPTPSETIACSYEYLSKNLFMPPNWTPSETGITVGKYRNANGNIYRASAISTGECGTTAPSHTTGTAVDSGVTWTYVSAPYETILTDNDICIFDDDLVKLGLRAKWRDEKGEDATKAEAEFNSKINRAVARLTPFSIGSFCGYGKDTRRYKPATDGGWL